jgi:uncharacterized membrane protein
MEAKYIGVKSRWTVYASLYTFDGVTNTSSPALRERIPSVDVLRGVIMVIMALDHVRDFVTNLRVQPEALARHGSVALFATRWITHFCAPVFALLAGVGIGLAMQRGKPVGEMRRFLLTRGLWLIALDLVITTPFWRFSFQLLPAFGLVLWSLGLSMIVMAAIIGLPRTAVGVVAVALIAGHNLFDGVTPQSLGAFAPLWNVLHVPGFAIPNVLLIGYPLVPWVAVMALGWVIAQAYAWAADRRRTVFIRAGLAVTIAFFIVRLMNGYGNPFLWSAQATDALTVASFFNVTKYPPSLDFLLMTLGPALIALALLERAHGRIARFFSVYGSVPLFYYVVHIPLVHFAAATLALVQLERFQGIPAVIDPSKIPAGYGVGLPGVYAIWTAVVLVMYPVCRWYSSYRSRTRTWWVRYL